MSPRTNGSAPATMVSKRFGVSVERRYQAVCSVCETLLVDTPDREQAMTKARDHASLHRERLRQAAHEPLTPPSTSPAEPAAES